jgi:regulation of enolase protein 1 (concanavalin A-like superfamily)
MGLSRGTQADLIGHWSLDEGQGDVARDSSGNGSDGVFQGSPQWVVGRIRGAMEFDGASWLDCGSNAKLAVTDSLTLCCWVNPTQLSGDRGFANRAGNYALKSSGTHLRFTTPGILDYDGLNSTLTAGTWQHVAATFQAGKTGGLVFYRDGVETDRQSSTGITAGTGPFRIGNNQWSEIFVGQIDDVRVYDSVLSAEELQTVMKGVGVELAADPHPLDGATDVPQDAVLAWTAGPFAKTHDVYFGTVFDDVNTASLTSPLGVLASRGQDGSTFDPAGLLAFGQTYYWRIDEVNAPDRPATFKGSTWSFTAEPYAYPVKPIKATASSSMSATMGPDKTIDGSGLDSLDQHSVSSSHMWLSKKNVTPIWIEYEFDKVYNLQEMWVWNSNQAVELAVGFGAKDVKVETSLDGGTWAVLADSLELAQATGEPNYVHNTTVSLGGVQAKYVKLTIADNWADSTKQAGLAEVRFFYVPVKAFAPSPASGGSAVALDATLNWRPGRGAVRHEVYVSADANAVAQAAAPVKTVTEHSLPLAPLALQYGRTYTWKVNEVNDAASPSVQEGDLWSFTTIGYAVVDDFESYDDACKRVFFSWIDGFGHSGATDCGVAPSSGNATGSTVGNVSAPFAERTITHGGKQSMPLAFDNTKSPFYSETQREWAAPQAWTGVNTLVVYLRGDAAAFLETSAGTIMMNGTGADIWGTSDQFRLAYKSLKGNGSIVAKVESVANTNEWAKAGVMIRESLAPGSTHAFVAVTPTASHGISYQRRPTLNGDSENTDVSNAPLPQWVKLTRNGNSFTAQYSADGKTWTDIVPTTPVSITMAADVFIGLAVTSHADTVTVAAFSNVSTTGNVTGQWQTAEIGIAQSGGNTPETFYVAVQDSSGKMKAVSNPNPNIIATGAWEQWSIPLTEFTSAGVDIGAVKKMMVGVGDRNTPKTGSAGKLYIDDIRLEP